MKRTVIVAGLILSAVIIAHAQDSRKIEARMVRQPFVGGDATHAIQEVALDLKAHAAGIGDRVAVRVCSKEKMPVALLAATASPFLLREYLEENEFENGRILFLRSEDCLAQDPSIAVTEFWVVPGGADPPPSVESIRADEVQSGFGETCQRDPVGPELSCGAARTGPKSQQSRLGICRSYRVVLQAAWCGFENELANGQTGAGAGRRSSESGFRTCCAIQWCT